MHERFGTYGAWLNPALGDAPRIDYAPQLEDLGYQTIWVGVGACPVGDLALVEQMVAVTNNAIIATAIINMWQDDARGIARHYHRIVDRHGPRLLLGVGLGHPETRDTYTRPFDRIADYVDALLADSVPAEAIVIGALGKRTLTLAGEKTLGAHPYLTVPAHTRYARAMLGGDAFLAPEHKVVLIEDADRARKTGRPAVQNPYLGLRNYTDNLLRHGFTDADIDGSGQRRTHRRPGRPRLPPDDQRSARRASRRRRRSRRHPDRGRGPHHLTRAGPPRPGRAPSHLR